MKHFFSAASVILLGVLLTACAAKTNLSALQADATIDVKSAKQNSTPRIDSFTVTSFGNYEFCAKAAGLEPFYGVLPLKFNGGYLVFDILFFTPLALFNLREVEAFYNFDIENKVVRYRMNEDDEWISYVPLDYEAARAREFFKNQEQAARGAAGGM